MTFIEKIRFSVEEIETILRILQFGSREVVFTTTFNNMKNL